MTSIPLAEPRPPPQLPRPPGLSRPPLGRAASHVIPPTDRRPSGLQRHASETWEDRAAKRRKTEGEPQAHQAFFPTNASPIVKISDSQPEDKSGHLRWLKLSAVRERVVKSHTTEEEESSSEDDLPELPPRPWMAFQVPKGPEEPKPSHCSRVQIPVPNTPDSVEFPTAAPQFVLRKPVGFFPWTGKHPEDVLSDTNVKTGYFDKPPNPTEKELNTARVPLYNAFKHKSGVDSLSILFSLVLDQKSQHGTISSVSTFKPPPRVTLTEMKRKSWIADLANPDVLLRRLSRTIPQGIRGQALLDQCLQSNVPLSRAIWFAKCVCANEIRTLKRKGTTPAMAVGTEGKWLREWTVNVEQFLEAHLAQSASPDWRSNIQYAIRLSTRLYLENLLDRDHYLDWILRCLNSSDSGHTPFWLMITHIHKQDLSQYRRRGSRLVQVFIDKARALEKTDESGVVAIRQKLRAALRELLFARPALFLKPETWPGNRKVVQGCLNLALPLERQLFERLDHANQRAMGHDKPGITSDKAPDQAIVDVLDAVHIPFDLTILDESLKAASPDFALRIHTCFEWSCTRFRQSKNRPYLVTRLVKRWQREGQDVDAAFLNYLGAFRENRTTADLQTLRHLVAQLSRSECFAMSKYMQWLLVRGLPLKDHVAIDTHAIFGSGVPAVPVESPSQIHFLLDLSLNKAANNAINLRQSILGRAGYDFVSEETTLRQCIRYVEEKLASLMTLSKRQTPTISEPCFAILPWTVRTSLSLWLRARALEGARASQTEPSLPGSKVLNEDQFFLIRHVLESMDDEAILADVVGILSASRNDDLVASLVATVHFHANTFSSIGAFDVLQRQLCQTYMNWRPIKPSMPLLTSSLLDLCSTFPPRTPATRLLQQDLVRGDRGRAVAACSPYSDGIAESLQQAGATFVEDFEAILQSETNMNEQTMNGLFSVLVDRIEKQQKFGDDPQTTLSFCQLLSRLRLCRKSQGDVLIVKWMSRLLPRLDSKWGPQLLRNVVATGGLGFGALLEAFAVSKQVARKNVALATFLYQVIAPDQGMVVDWPSYQTRTKWYEYCQKEPRATLEVLCGAGLQGVSSTFDALLMSALLNDATTTLSVFSGSSRQWFVKALSQSLGCREGELSKADIHTVFQATSVFSHRHVQLRLAGVSPSSTGGVSGATHDELADVLYATLKQTVQEPASSAGQDRKMLHFLRTVDAETATSIRHRVESDFVEALPKLPVAKVTSPATAVFPGDAQQLSSIVEHAFEVCRKDTTPRPGFVSQLIERLSQHFKALGQSAANPNTPITSAPPIIPGLSVPSTAMNPPLTPGAASTSSFGMTETAYTACPTLCMEYLKSLLQMICLQRPGLIATGRGGASAKQGQSEQVQLLVRLASIATHPAMTAASAQPENTKHQSMAKDTIQFIFDIIATIIDEVSDEVNMMCMRLLKDKLYDGRLRYAFGSINLLGSDQVRDMGQGLQLVKEGKGVIGEWKPRMWEVLDNASGKENETSLGLGLFGASYGQSG